MGHLVLDHAAGELVKDFGHLLSCLVVILHCHGCRTAHVAINTRNAEAAFGIDSGLFTFLHYDRIDHGADEILKIRIDIRHSCAVHDEHSAAHANLRSGESASLG